jgi:cell division protein FtsB
VIRQARLWLGRRWHFGGALLLLVYFAYHGLHGERGFYAWIDKARSLEEAKQQLARLETDLTALDRTVQGLQPDRSDPDLLEEQLRGLGYIARDEVMILTTEMVDRRR